MEQGWRSSTKTTLRLTKIIRRLVGFEATCRAVLRAVTVMESTLHTLQVSQQIYFHEKYFMFAKIFDEVFENILLLTGTTTVFSPLSCDNNSDYQMMESSRLVKHEIVSNCKP